MINIKNNTRKILANNIIYFRNKNNWTQKILAEKLNTSQVSISQLENAKRNVSFDYLDKLANVFNVKPHELLVEKHVKT